MHKRVHTMYLGAEQKRSQNDYNSHPLQILTAGDESTRSGGAPIAGFNICIDCWLVLCLN